MPRLKHVPAFDGAYSYGGNTWEMSDGFFEVDDESLANELVESSTKIRFVEGGSGDETPTPEGDETTFRCGVNDCSREVDSPEATCWQHE